LPCKGAIFFCPGSYSSILSSDMRKNTILIISTFLINYSLFAQDSRSIGADSPKSKVFLASSKQAEALLEAYRSHPYTIYYDNLIVEYEKRMRTNAHKYKVMARKMKKPQYSDPSYFGHKRKPKKRAVGKRKYCHECEIVH
jgi:hypothetical protein